MWRQVVPHSPTTRFPNAKYIQATMKLQAALDAGASWSGRERNRVYLNLGDTRFAQVSACSGLDFIDDARGVGLVGTRTATWTCGSAIAPARECD